MKRLIFIFLYMYQQYFVRISSAKFKNPIVDKASVIHGEYFLIGLLTQYAIIYTDLVIHVIYQIIHCFIQYSTTRNIGFSSVALPNTTVIIFALYIIQYIDNYQKMVFYLF